MVTVMVIDEFTAEDLIGGKLVVGESWIMDVVRIEDRAPDVCAEHTCTHQIIAEMWGPHSGPFHDMPYAVFDKYQRKVHSGIMNPAEPGYEIVILRSYDYFTVRIGAEMA